MSERFERYRSARCVPRETWTWNMYGAGIERIGRNGKPERFPVPTPGPDQLLVRVDAVGMCFSDTKLIKQGGKHPKLYDRDLEQQPTVLGHEVALTVIQAGEKLAGRYHVGQRLALQPDIYDEAGRSTAFGTPSREASPSTCCSVPRCSTSTASASSCPSRGRWATPRHRSPNRGPASRARIRSAGGWNRCRAGSCGSSVRRPATRRAYRCTGRLSAPGTFVLTDVPAGLADAVRAEAARRGARVIVRDGLRRADFGALSAE